VPEAELPSDADRAEPPGDVDRSEDSAVGGSARTESLDELRSSGRAGALRDVDGSADRAADTRQSH
jgi:hypothetical protein